MSTDIPCDSGYVSADDEIMSGLEAVAQDDLNMIEEHPFVLDRVIAGHAASKESSGDEEEESFQDWLKKVAECLEGRKRGDPEKMEESVPESVTEDERCMKVARSVLDEETVLDMVKTFLKFTQVSIFLFMIYLFSVYLFVP